MGAGVLVGDAVLELVRLGRQILLLVRRRRVLGFRRVLCLYVRGSVVQTAVVGRGVSGGDAHNGEEDETLKERGGIDCNVEGGQVLLLPTELVSSSPTIHSLAERRIRRPSYPFTFMPAEE